MALQPLSKSLTWEFRRNRRYNLTTVLIDGDVVAYRCSAACNDKDESEVVKAISGMMSDIINTVEADRQTTYLTSPDNFRRKIYPLYKSNRKQEKPQFLQYAKDYLTEMWGAITEPELEADDCLAMYYTEDSVIATIDKDLDQIAGDHFNFVTGRRYFIEEVQADFNFWTQMIMGDSGDGVPGLPRWGAKKAHEFVSSLDSYAWEDEVRSLYERVLSEDHYILYRNLLWMRRFPHDVYMPYCNGSYESAIKELTMIGESIASTQTDSKG